MENEIGSTHTPSPTRQPPPTEEEEQPNPKKIKMSSTTTSDDDEQIDPSSNPPEERNADVPHRKPRYKRRKIAMFFAYCGVGYQGMQKNPGAKTIEGELEEALFLAGAVPEQDRSCPRRYDWARSARTDKGVSAVGQVVSGRFYIDPPGLVKRLNSILPPQIRIFGYKRATGAFSAKKFCDKRRYIYLIPVFALDPSCHRDQESALASVSSENELAKCIECSERGRKVLGIMGKHSFEAKNGGEVISKGDNQSGVSSNSGNALVSGEIGSNVQSGITSNNGNAEVLKNSSADTLGGGNDMEVLENGIAPVVEKNEEGLKKAEFCYGEEEKERFNRILKYYIGTHNFYNFTSRTKAEDPSAKRFIISFEANTTVTVEGIEFVKCEVVGQSFMLHQIRKMIGLAVAVMRNIVPESLIESAFRPDVDINVPMAPEVGLYLDECFFSSYNRKWKDTHEELSMKAYEEEAHDFKMKYIYSHIASTEHKEGVVALWLHSLNYRNSSDLHSGSNEIKPDNASLEVDG